MLRQRLAESCSSLLPTQLPSRQRQRLFQTPGAWHAANRGGGKRSLLQTLQCRTEVHHKTLASTGRAHNASARCMLTLAKKHNKNHTPPKKTHTQKRNSTTAVQLQRIEPNLASNVIQENCKESHTNKQRRDACRDVAQGLHTTQQNTTSCQLPKCRATLACVEPRAVGCCQRRWISLVGTTATTTAPDEAVCRLKHQKPHQEPRRSRSNHVPGDVREYVACSQQCANTQATRC